MLEAVVQTIDHLNSNLADNTELYDMSKADGDFDGLLFKWSMVCTTASSMRFSRPSSCARLGSFQTLGFSSAALTSFSRSALRS